MIKTISLFSGSGGLDLGFIQTNRFDIIFANDIDISACNTYRKNIGNHIINKDIRAVSINQKADLIIGGPPCQGFSTANPNRALDDPRNWLFKEYIRILKEVNPKVFLMENVMGLSTMGDGRIFSIIKSAFEKAGYTLYEKVLNAVNYEVPQSRNRIILVGVRSSLKDRYLFPEPTINPPLMGRYVTVRDAIMKIDIPPDDPNHKVSALTSLNYERILHIPAGGSMKDCPDHLHNNSDLKRSMRRLHPDKPSYTIVHNNCDHYYHPVEHRRLTIREMALLQTYPIDFIFCGSKSDQSKQVGNSVPVKLGFHLAESIFQFLKPNEWSRNKNQRNDLLEKSMY